ncbi:ABC transporter substrate-binding protein [Paenibacillus mesophilus]|uniref:ABC transporter substrate-binding protein n=1 Tax=Paenibacillus mesophilus TaxID=2582849 RepID=UPI001EE4D824|nr:extracellular solute-binding protein [Paenibacillus mesophilus]
MRISRGAAALTAAAVMLAGCGAGGTEAKLKELGKDEKATIKVVSTTDERMFSQQYGQLFSVKYPNIDIQYVSTQGVIKYGPDTDFNKEYEKFLDEQKPDVLILSMDLYERMADSGKLYDLEPVIRQDKFDLSGILPAVLDTIKSRSGGKLYGLAPSFNSQALFYNKSLFDKNGVPYPKDEMSWEELLDLARRFPTTGDDATRAYGFGLGNLDSLYRLVTMIGTTKGLNFVDPDSLTMTMKTDGWKQAAQLGLDAYKSKAVYRQNPNQQFRGGTMEDFYRQDPFIGGRVAMMISGTYYLDSLRQAKTALRDDMPQWDLVTVPVDAGNPGTTASLSVNQIFAVNAQSPNVRAAWEFVKYINDNEYARVTSKTPAFGSITSRASYLKDTEGRNIEAFYKIKGNSAAFNKAMANIPPAFIGQLYGIAEAEFKEALEGRKTIDEALQAIQEKGQIELTKAKQAEEQKKKG